LILIVPFNQIAYRLKVGDVGIVKGSGFVAFGGVDIPLLGLESFRQGQSVRIDSFDANMPKLIPSAMPAKSMCPNCGHQY
jgi:hypothetical protein